MSIFNNPEENYWRNFFTKLFLVLVTVAIIICFLPRNEGRQYRYDVGKPWMYGSVIAKFDFPIYKTDEAIKHEQDSMLSQFQPYFSINKDIGEQQVKRFIENYRQGIPGLPREQSCFCRNNRDGDATRCCAPETRFSNSGESLTENNTNNLPCFH